MQPTTIPILVNVTFKPEPALESTNLAEKYKDALKNKRRLQAESDSKYEVYIKTNRDLVMAQAVSDNLLKLLQAALITESLK